MAANIFVVTDPLRGLEVVDTLRRILAESFARLALADTHHVWFLLSDNNWYFKVMLEFDKNSKI